VIPICEDSTAPPEDPVDSFRQANAGALHPAAERPGAVGLDEEMDVVGLDGIVHDAKGGRRGGGKAVTKRREEGSAAQRGQSGQDPQRHVNRMMVLVEWAWVVWHAGHQPGGLATRARPMAAPGADP